MAKRSPILGFNHNFRHRGLVFHVQTEDSGVNNPHIFTHLFNGGVIVSSRKLTYDASSANEVVKALMQAQHKAMLKDLKKGTFDEKIDDYFGNDENLDGGATQKLDVVDLEFLQDIGTDAVLLADDVIELDTPIQKGPLAQTIPGGHRQPNKSRTNPFEKLEIALPSKLDAMRAGSSPQPVGESPSGAVLIHAAAPESAPDPPGAKPSGPGEYHKTGKVGRLERPGGAPDSPTPTPQPAPPREVARPVGKAGRRDRPRQPTMPISSGPSRGSSVITNQSVIVGAPPQVVGGSHTTKTARPPGMSAKREPTQPRAREHGGSLFGKDLISE